jgi:hypothetical protein
MSASVQFPPVDCVAARRAGFATTTAGACMKARGIPGDAHDPHCGLTSALAPRAALLTQAVQSALGTLQAQARGRTSAPRVAASAASVAAARAQRRGKRI